MTKSRPALSAWENDRTIVRFPDPAVEVVDERFRSLVVWQEVVERLWTGGRWLEGPVWFGDGRYLLFSDIPNNRMLCWSEVTRDVTVFRQPSNNSSGNTRDRQGRLVTCEHLTDASLGRNSGINDLLPATCETYTKWVIEDKFCNGRPELELGGVEFRSAGQFAASRSIAKTNALKRSQTSRQLRSLEKSHGAANSYQRGSRNPRPPDSLAFWRRYSA
jgi:hypothetical protein